MSYDKLSPYATAIADNHSALSITYHRTMIVFYDKATGIITLRSGGWQTFTTKRKMNQAAQQFGLAFSVHQRKGDWYVDRWNGGAWAGLDIPFEDGMSFPRDVASHIANVKQLGKVA